MKTRSPKMGVGSKNSLWPSEALNENTPSSSEKQQDQTKSSPRCKCGDESSRNRIINITEGMYDAEALRRDLSMIDILKRYQRRMKYGYCRKCANEYLVSFFTKLDFMDQRRVIR